MIVHDPAAEPALTGDAVQRVDLGFSLEAPTGHRFLIRSRLLGG